MGQHGRASVCFLLQVLASLAPARPPEQLSQTLVTKTTLDVGASPVGGADGKVVMGEVAAGASGLHGERRRMAGVRGRRG